MSLTDFFTLLGAPLANPRWSWGAVRATDGAVFLRVWQDRFIRHEGLPYLEIVRHGRHQRASDNLGYQERLRHVELIRMGALCYLVMCRVVNENARPRTIKEFNANEVFQGGNIIELGGDKWIEQRGRLSVAEVRVG